MRARGPVLLMAISVVAVLFLYQWLVWPIVADVMNDWQYLHAARQIDLQRAQQQMQQAQPRQPGPQGK